jgi:hypothetical protein
MEMFLMALALSVIGVVVSGVLFAAATRGEEREPFVTLRAPSRAVSQPARRSLGQGGRFFGDVTPAAPPVPVEALLLQIEQHVRLEQAAAEAFLNAPTRQSLHCRTMSPLVH